MLSDDTFIIMTFPYRTLNHDSMKRTNRYEISIKVPSAAELSLGSSSSATMCQMCTKNSTPVVSVTVRILSTHPGHELDYFGLLMIDLNIFSPS